MAIRLYLQMLLVVCAGSMTASMPFVSALYAAVLTAWSSAVGRLDQIHMSTFAKGQSNTDQQHVAASAESGRSQHCKTVHDHSPDSDSPPSLQMSRSSA